MTKKRNNYSDIKTQYNLYASTDKNNLNKNKLQLTQFIFYSCSCYVPRSNQIPCSKASSYFNLVRQYGAQKAWNPYRARHSCASDERKRVLSDEFHVINEKKKESHPA